MMHMESLTKVLLILSENSLSYDEVRHALACSSVASSFAGSDLSPGALNIEGAMKGGVTPEDVMVQTILEGCINETLAAAEAAWLSEQCEIAPIQKILRQIAKDETRHATLGWKTIRWILKEHPKLTGLASYTFESARPYLSKEVTNKGDDQWMAAFGCVPSKKREEIIADVWRRVIDPCAKAMTDSSAA